MQKPADLPDLDHPTLDADLIRHSLYNRLVYTIGKDPITATDRDWFFAAAAVQAAGIAIWDVYASCERAGSLDTAIRDAMPNPLVALQKCPQGRTAPAPALRRICFNGRTAARRLREMEALGYEAMVLPSTSPAHAGMSFEEKLARWQGALRPAA